jgi:hypothetical protein
MVFPAVSVGPQAMEGRGSSGEHGGWTANAIHLIYHAAVAAQHK